MPSLPESISSIRPRPRLWILVLVIGYWFENKNKSISKFSTSGSSTKKKSVVVSRIVSASRLKTTGPGRYYLYEYVLVRVKNNNTKFFVRSKF